MYNKLINRLPSNYKKDKGSNIGKLYQVLASELQELNEVFIKIKKFQDMDNAAGKTLDRIGKNVMELRSTNDDELYRQLIKTKIIANLSKGDIETINQVADTLMGDKFLGIRESWSDEIYDDPAGLIIGIKPQSVRLPKVLNRVKAGGVKLYYEANGKPTEIVINYRDYKFPTEYKICNRFQTADVEGGLAQIPFILEEHIYSSPVNYKVCNKFTTASITSEKVSKDIVLEGDYKDNEVLFKRVGDTIVGKGEI